VLSVTTHNHRSQPFTLADFLTATDPLPAALNGAVQSASPFKNGLKGACFLYQ
jgi:hypothetical protein